MTEIERNILECLNELDRLVQSMRTAEPKPNLIPIFTRLDELTAQLSRNADPSLLHYLHKKSYEKARLFLEDLNAKG